MAPTAFTFSGIKICIYIEDHLPIHVHAIHAKYGTIYELILDDGKLVDIYLREVPGREPLPAATNKKVIKFWKNIIKA